MQVRGFGLAQVLGEPQGIAVILLAALTQLGDVWFLFSLLALLYWLGTERLATDPRRTAAVLVGLGIAQSALLIGMKAFFAFPRPPGAAEAAIPMWLPTTVDSAVTWAATADGYSFPSGHAFGTTVIYGAMAVLLDVWDRRRRLLGAGALIGLVAFTRVALGVHYLTDVLAGIALGIVFLAVTLRLVAGRPTRAFEVATLAGLFAIGASLYGGHSKSVADAAATLGAGLGGLVAWHWFSAGSASRTLRRVEAGVGLLFAGGLWIVVYTADLTLPVALAANGVALGAIVALPELVGRLLE